MNRCTVDMSTLCRLAVVQTDYSCFKRCKHYRGFTGHIPSNKCCHKPLQTHTICRELIKRGKETCYPGAYQRIKSWRSGCVQINNRKKDKQNA